MPNPEIHPHPAIPADASSGHQADARTPAPVHPGGPPQSSEAEREQAETEAVEILKKQLAEARAGKAAALETAEAERRRAAQEGQRAKNYQQDAVVTRQELAKSTLTQITQALQAWENEATNAEREYQNALEGANHAAAAAAMRRMSKAEAEVSNLSRDKITAEAEAATPDGAPAPRSQQPDPNQIVTISDDQWLGTLEPRLQTILRSNPAKFITRKEVVNDKGQRVSVPLVSDAGMLHHHAALGAGINPATDPEKYWKFVEGRVFGGEQQPPAAPREEPTSGAGDVQLADDPNDPANANAGYQNPGDETAPVPDVPTGAKRRPQPAPTSRDAHSPGPRISKNARTLTPEEKEAAKYSFGANNPNAEELYLAAKQQLDTEQPDWRMKGRRH